MTNAQLQQLAEEWQRLLRIQDWDVTVRFARPVEMFDRDLLGQCRTLANLKEAQVLICDPAQAPEPMDVEYVLAHELGHILLDPLATKSNMLHVEQALHGFVHALIKLRKGDKHEEQVDLVTAVKHAGSSGNKDRAEGRTRRRRKA